VEPGFKKIGRLDGLYQFASFVVGFGDIRLGLVGTRGTWRFGFIVAIRRTLAVSAAHKSPADIEPILRPVLAVSVTHRTFKVKEAVTGLSE
jgi:hypothetical protein